MSPSVGTVVSANAQRRPDRASVDHTQKQMSHDAINRYLRDDRLTPRLIWENVRSQIQASAHGYVVFDDTVLDKNFSHKIELARRQYGGNAHRLIKGIGLVNCVYVNPETGRYACGYLR